MYLDPSSSGIRFGGAATDSRAPERDRLCLANVTDPHTKGELPPPTPRPPLDAQTRNLRLVPAQLRPPATNTALQGFGLADL